MKIAPTSRRARLFFGALVSVGVVVALAYAAGRLATGDREDTPVPESIASRGDPAIRLISVNGSRGGHFPLATDGTSLWYAAREGGTDAGGLYRFDPASGKSERVSSLEWYEFPQWMGRIEGATVLMTGHRVVVVRDDGAKDSVALPPVTHYAGLGGDNYVEAVSIYGNLLFMVRSDALEVDVFQLAPKVAVLPAIPLPPNLPPPKSIRPLGGDKLLLATHVSHAAKGYGTGTWVLDTTTGTAEPVAGAKAPSAISEAGPVVLSDSGMLARFDPAGSRLTAMAAAPAPTASLAATANGGGWHIGFEETAITFTSASGSQRRFQLPTIVDYYGGSPAGEQEMLVRRDRTVSVGMMVTLKDGSLAFSAAGDSFIGVIARPK